MEEHGRITSSGDKDSGAVRINDLGVGDYY